MKQKQRHFWRRAALTLLVLLFTAATAWADSYPEYITDIAVVGGTASEATTAAQYYENLGYTTIYSDLNANAGGNYIYLCYKTGSRASTNGGYITDLRVYVGSTYSEEMTFDDITYYLAPRRGGSWFTNDVKGDLNAGCGSSTADIHLYYTKNNFTDKRVVNSVWITNGEGTGSGAVSGVDLNQGCGKKSDYIYLHMSTTTKVNRPEYDPVFKTDLVYNGSAQQLLSKNPTGQCTMYYCVDSNSGSFVSPTSSVTATTAGTHTVYYYAGANVYGNRYPSLNSSTFSQTVNIAKSPNSNASVSVNVSSKNIYGYESILSKLSVVNNLSTGSVTWLFSESANGTYSTTVPTTVNKTYYVKACIAGDSNCYEYTTSYATFYLLDWTGDGTSGNPYQINNIYDMNRIATRVNSGTDYSGKYFKLTTNLTYSGTNNYTAIGNGSYKFYGAFDGGGFTISGINISQASTKYQGLFGYLGEGAVVKDVNLTNSVILGYDFSGGIAGYNYGTISGCTVASTVQVQATKSNAYWHGGIVGNNYGTVSGCTSSAQLTCASGQYYGGIVGKNYGTVSGNFVIGATVPSASYNGAIVGYEDGGSLSNNYYYNCTVAGVSNATGKGCQGADVTSNNGAVSVHTLSLASGVSTSTSASKTYNGTNYYVKGKTIALSYSGIIPEGCTLTYQMNDAAIEGNTFTMPLTDVSVRPALDLPEGLCIDYDCSYTSPEYFYVNMPKKGSLSVTIPKGITAFKVYDYAGRWGKYSYDDSAVGDTYLYLTVPAGNAIEVSGQYAVEEDEHAHIIDMDGTVIRRITGSRWGLYFSLDKTYKSTSQGIGVRFDMGDGLYRMGTCEGLDLTMRLVPNVSEVKLAEKYDTPFIVETAAENDESYNVTLLDRTLWRDGDWNTLCLPFEVDLNDKDCPLANATARTLESASLSDDFEHLTLNFGQPVEKLEAGVPYIIRWEASANNIVNPVFKNVKVYSQQHDFISEDNRVHFRGTYDKLTFADEDQNILMLGAQNSLFWPDGKAPSTLGACRAYFELGGLLVNAAQIRSFELNFEGESETAITNLKPEHDDDSWYALDGRKVNQPGKGGLFIHNNKKMIIK